jgi:hypothetical protein
MPVTLAVVTMLGGIFAENPVAQSFYGALQALEAQQKSAIAAKVPAPIVVINIRSSGGSVDFARAMASRMRGLNPVCMVAEAQSAALQILLPACGKIVVTKETQIGFHSAAMCFKPRLYDGQDFLYALRSSLSVSIEMGKEMEAGLGAAHPASCNLIRKAYPEIATLSCASLHMFAETETTGPGFKHMFPASTKIVVVDKINVPEYPKSDGPGVNICEQE